MPGRHNAENAAAASALACSLGIDPCVIASALSEFSGIPRRAQRIADIGGAAVYYDYGHHPKEIELTIDTLKKMRYNKIAVVFAPHTYSRTRALLDDFASVLATASVSFILPIFGAREKADGIGASTLAARIRERGGVALFKENELEQIFKGDHDCILLSGAGDLSEIKQRIENYEEDHSACSTRADLDSRSSNDNSGRG